MPTPVSVARQCLAEAAAAVLDDAITVAKRRSHAQTTSLHIVSALLALPSSTLREACTRSRSSAYSPRLQFRALELCVGVALDRVSVSKSAVDEPPVSNSLMAAIKRSQANQRRHPETFHLYQLQLNSDSLNSSSMSAVKVELKHFVMSILDDPIVSRVLGDAGFRTQEIKMAILNPLTMSRFSSTTSRPPPLFLCSLSDLDLNNFPFSEDAATEKVDENSRRIGDILLKSRRRNPLLIGVYASDAYRKFVDCLKRGETGVLPKEIDGLSVVSIEHEISECISSEEMMEVKFKQVVEMLQDCQGPGFIVNVGDLKAFLNVKSVDVVNSVVSKMKGLLINPGGKLWLIGFLSGDGDYKKLIERFPSIEMDWDLHLLPITTSSIGENFMRSFVPFGGFFTMPSELESLCTTATKSSRLCNLCNEKYEQEVSDVLKGVSTNSVADKQSVNLSSWLQIAECETSNRCLTVEAKEDQTILDARVTALKRKWSDICQRLHCSSTSQEDITLPNPHTSFQNFHIQKESANVSPCMPSDFQTIYLPKQEIIPKPVVLSTSVDTQSEIRVQGLELNDFQNSSASQKKMMSLPIACTSSPPVTTDLTLGTTLSDSAEECRRKPNLQEHYNGIQHSESSLSYDILSHQVSQSSSCSYHREKQMYTKDLENSWNVLAEKVYWQVEAIQTISQTVSHCRNGNGRYHCSNKGNVWLSFVGPDKVGKRKIASAVAEIVFGGKEHLLSFDLSSQDVISPFNSIIDCHDPKYHKMKSGRKMIVDYLADELTKHPHSVVLLENVEKADLLVRIVYLKQSKRVNFRFPWKGNQHQQQCFCPRIDCPKEDTDTVKSDDENDDSDDSEVWLEELLEHVDENVAFKPFDFDSLTQKILKKIDARLKQVGGSTLLLEIDREVMVQILAAAWLTDGKNALEDWIEQVLCLSMEEARQSCNVTSDVVMKLVQYDGLVVEAQASELCLPARIKVK
ncbi:hypothetical protein DH2020_000701 [Rehmannia glutinosa]|uniref:Clp R domain-containing protein n=1 Tax=Rehmannia glutinosa TaxID=99300 RepID=A0ABR0XX74_REHGL